MPGRFVPRGAALLLSSILLACPQAAAPAGTGVVSFTDRLAARGEVEIPVEQAREIEGKLGQLLVVNVDGFGWQGELAVLPEFLPMVEALQVGGVIPHYGTSGYERIRATNRELRRLTRLPLLVCCDIVTLRANDASGAARSARFGDGYRGGFIGKYADLDDAGFRALAALNAFALAAIGVNTALGPTVDDSTGDARTAQRARVVMGELRRFGLEPVIKHFPFLPAKANLHKESPDTRVPQEEVARRTEVFRDLGDEAGILMTTHTFDSLIDPRSIVTFSPRWHELLVRRTGFGGLIMSDGLLMLRNYRDPALARGGPVDWAVRAILAGQDLVIVEGGQAITYRVFEGILSAACRRTEAGRLLRERIIESSGRITRFKEQRKDTLLRSIDVPADSLAAAAALAASAAAASRFHPSPETLERLGLEAAALSPAAP